MTIQAYNMKVVISGGVYEFYRYEDTVFRGYEQKRGASAVNIYYDSEGTALKLDYETGELIPKNLESRARSNIRARNELRRLALSNFSNKSKFITLTFKEDMRDIAESNKLFKAFARKLRKIQTGFKYIAVIEFTKAGRIHYHMLCNLKYVPAKKIEKAWGQGFIKINRIDHVDNIGAYVIKYMTKDDADTRLIGKKMYQTSKGLKRPEEIIGKKAEYLYEQMKKEQRKKVYSSSYENKQTTNKIFYEEYNLKR
ncbi:Rep protein [Priestia megaterium]